jgi:O-antigen/teichoic acid export membrane protein
LSLTIGSAVQRLNDLISSLRDLLARKDAAAVARRASAIALVIRLGNAGLAYVAQVVLARLMGQYEYGLFAYTWVWFMVLSAVGTLGFGDSPIRYIPIFRELGEQAHLRGFIRFAFAVTIATSVLLGAVVIAVLPAASRWIESAYVLPMVLMALSVPFAGIQSVFEGIGRNYAWTIPSLLPIYILRHGLLLAFMLLAVWLGVDATASNAFICLVAVLVTSTIYQAAVILLRLRRVIGPGLAAYRPWEWVKGAAPFSILHGSAFISSFADVLVLSFFVSPADLAIYFAATRVIQVVNLVPFATMVGTAHRFSAAHARGDREDLQRLCSNAALTSFAIAGAAVAVIMMLGDWLLGMFGSGFEAGLPALLILSAGVIARVAAGPSEDVLNMTGHGGLSASTYLVMVLVNVALNVALVTHFGIIGAAVATSCALTARAAWLSWVVYRRLGIRTSVVSALIRLREGRAAGGAQIGVPAE